MAKKYQPLHHLIRNNYISVIRQHALMYSQIIVSDITPFASGVPEGVLVQYLSCLLYTSDAADE